MTRAVAAGSAVAALGTVSPGSRLHAQALRGRAARPRAVVTLPTATVRLNVQPACAAIELNGVPETRRSVVVPLGPVCIGVTAPGYLPMTAETTLTRSGTVLTLSARLPLDTAPGRLLPLRVVDMRPPRVPRASGFLTVITDSSATVLLDSDSVGVTPLRALRLPPGEYYLRLVRRGRRGPEAMINVTPGDTLRLTLPPVRAG